MEMRLYLWVSFFRVDSRYACKRELNTRYHSVLCLKSYLEGEWVSVWVYLLSSSTTKISTRFIHPEWKYVHFISQCYLWLTLLSFFNFIFLFIHKVLINEILFSSGNIVMYRKQFSTIIIRRSHSSSKILYGNHRLHSCFVIAIA